MLPLTIFDTVAQADGDPLQRPTLLLRRLNQGLSLLDDIHGHHLDGLVPARSLIVNRAVRYMEDSPDL